eukprot:1175886-Karenia_brevis.AAC.1
MVFRKAGLGMGTSLTLLNSLANSTLFHNSHTWNTLSKVEQRSLTTTYMKGLRAAAGKRYDAEQHLTDAEILTLTGSVRVEIHISHARLR